MTLMQAPVAAAMGWSQAGLEVFLTEHRQFSQRWDTMRKRLVENERLPQPTLVAIGDVEKIDARIQAHVCF